MQAFTPKKPTSDSGHPGDEELAAYVDGMLEGEEKARVTEHLAACADCYRVCSETLRFQLEEEETQEQEEEVAAAAAATVVPFPAERRVSPPWWLAAAAAALVVGVGAGLFMLVGPAPEMTTAKLVAPLQGEPIHGTDLWTPRKRGGGPGGGIALPPEELTDSKNTFGIGVQLVNLQVGLERNDPEVADAVLPLLLGLLEEGLLIDPRFPEFFKDLGEALRKGEASPKLVQEASRKSEELREFLSPDPNLELGRFVETGRLAAIAGEPAFFKKWTTRRLLRHFLKQQEEGELSLAPETVRNLEAISERRGKGDLQAADFEALKKDFEKILQRQYPP